MTFQDLKIYAINGSSLMISFTNIDVVLKLTLMLVSIGYTLHKWYLMTKNKKND